MKVASKKLRKSIKSNLDAFSKHLPLRIYALLDSFCDQDLGTSKEIDVFEALVRLLIRADQEPAAFVADLMSVLHPDDIAALDTWTISAASSFLRDHLKKDDTLRSLNDSLV